VRRRFPSAAATSSSIASTSRPEGPSIPGLGVLDVTTRAGTKRFVNSLLAEAPQGTLIGFENHSGRTYLGPAARPLGTVLVGHGNNGEETEGAVQGKIVRTYCHGSVLPKNPWLADLLLGWALERRHGPVTLEPLDDGEELAAQRFAVEVARASLKSSSRQRHVAD
jgi:CobQ-like glutamine amidotransferase family enzyme